MSHEEQHQSLTEVLQKKIDETLIENQKLEEKYLEREKECYDLNNLCEIFKNKLQISLKELQLAKDAQRSSMLNDARARESLKYWKNKIEPLESQNIKDQQKISQMEKKISETKLYNEQIEKDLVVLQQSDSKLKEEQKNRKESEYEQNRQKVRITELWDIIECNQNEIAIEKNRFRREKENLQEEIAILKDQLGTKDNLIQELKVKLANYVLSVEHESISIQTETEK